ncbi:SLATT domain-containing protein [Sphingomonas sp. NIBR02145]|uniref:SLATT domain-containing protein n=1 Tax=Sphingomonas sp. NIBR02145 TaxID=3014784 RepID=UPI0022B3F57C|nr:SLATT domain-containing protein [Sphingomonas sp. NIBR02145]WHU02749.1 SLATT domain-containing protein [Sphingomonas sp. NIBR02145]
MDRPALLKCIAETGYNVGFGAKKHFATYDIVSKIPGFIGFLSLAVGTLALVIDELSKKLPSAAMVILGVIALYIAYYDHTRERYNEVGVELTKIYNNLRKLYRDVQSSGATDFSTEEAELYRLEGEYYTRSITKQIMFSDWYAHYKFFWQHQIDWIEEQKQFTFWRDKMPLTGTVALVALSLAAVAGGIWTYCR